VEPSKPAKPCSVGFDGPQLGEFQKIGRPPQGSDAPAVEPADSWEWIVERAAIMEIEGKLSRAQADAEAFELWYRRFVGPSAK
jgi:hypothetical protein